MATKTDGEVNGYTFQWTIENISNCWWLKKKKKIRSPYFMADGLEDTKWVLGLNLHGGVDGDDVSLYLVRPLYCSGPPVIKVKYQLAFLDKEGITLKEETKSDSFKKNFLSGFGTFAARKVLFDLEREAFLPEDTLTVQCTLQKAEETLVESKHLYAQTVLNMSRKSFDWRIDRFSTIKSEVRTKFKDDLIEFDLVLSNDFEKTLDIEMISFNACIQYISCNTLIIDSAEKMVNCGVAKYNDFNDPMKGKLTPALYFPNKMLENRSRYLPNDVLSLKFKFAFLTQSSFLNSMLELKIVEKEKSECTKVLIDEMKSLYDEGISCDIELRTTTKSFSAHKAILSARSPVFKIMFSHDMKEKNSGYVDIADFDDDTIHRMLVYIYTAVIEDLQLESASKLYEAADKYSILRLVKRCSSFLKQNLCPESACDVLILADLHNDDDLKNAVEDYILKQRKLIFNSQKWKVFMKNHLKLAADVMYKRMCLE